VISATEIGISVMAFIWTVLRILVCYNFWEVHFTAVIMPNFFGLTESNIIGICFWQIFFGYSLQNHVCQVLSAQGLPEDRERRCSI
jgi:hypothetical protein